MANHIDWDKELQNIDPGRYIEHQGYCDIQLKPCPFCGTKNLWVGMLGFDGDYIGEYYGDPYGGWKFSVIHGRTGCILDSSDGEMVFDPVGHWWHNTAESAVAAWNQRMSDD